MTTLIQSLRKKGSLFLLLLGTLMLAMSVSNAAFADSPACDGVSCANMGQPLRDEVCLQQQWPHLPGQHHGTQ